MKVLLDESGYWTGGFSTLGSIEGSITVPSLPEDYDIKFAAAYKWENSAWVFDEEKKKQIEDALKDPQGVFVPLITYSKQDKVDVNKTTGIAAMHGGNILLDEKFTNYDEVIIVTTDINNETLHYRTWKTDELLLAFMRSYKFPISNINANEQWEVYGMTRTGSDETYALSTANIWVTANMLGGISQIYGKRLT